jgi:hypothetical protein
VSCYIQIVEALIWYHFIKDIVRCTIRTKFLFLFLSEILICFSLVFFSIELL